MKSAILLSLIVGCTVVSDVVASFEMKRHGEIDDFRPSRIGRLIGALIQRKFVILSVFCMTISFFSFMLLVEEEDLSLAVPASAASIVLETILAKLVLKERIPLLRWAGVVLVAAGVWLLAA